MEEVRDKKDMDYRDLVKGYRARGYKLRYYGKVRENTKTYHLYKIVINPRYRKTLLITTGFHGDEFNGPISTLEIIDNVAAYARTHHIRIVVYICINPGGFDAGTHYNPSREYFNNDFMRYLIRTGRWVGTLKKGESYSATKRVPSPAKEVRLLQRDLHDHYDSPVPDAVLDIHQQKGNLENGEVFAYIPDRPGTYRRIMKKIERVATIAKNDKWFDVEDGRKIHKRIDKDGFVFIHDGTVTDMFYRHGTRFVVTSETKTTLPLDQVVRINLIWAKELIKLVAKDAKRKKSKKKQ